MGLLENLKANREENKIRKIERQEKFQLARAKAQAAYDIEFERNAVAAVKGRAKREAFERFGQSPKERRRKAIEGFASSMGGLGQIGANMGNPFGNETTPRRSSGANRSKSTSGYHKRKSSRSHRSQKQKDPFDFDLPF